MNSAVDEILRADGMIPVTSKTISELIQEVFRLRQEIQSLNLTTRPIASPYYVREGAHGEWCVDKRQYSPQGQFISRAATRADAERFAAEMNKSAI